MGKLVNNVRARDDGTLMGSTHFELQFRPDHTLVTLVRRFVAELYRRLLDDPVGTSRIALATHELLENVVKYAKDGEATMRIEVDLDQRPRLVTVAIRNRAEPVDIAAMRAVLDGVEGAGDAAAFYQRLLVQRAKQRSSPGGLGLARICAEAETRITCRVLDNDVTVIEATIPVGRGPSRE